VRILIRNTGSEEWKGIEPIRAAEIELQRLLIKSPEILPVEDLNVTFIVAVSEFGLGAGFADILAFGADGDIAIIECKRADNPEVKRKVIGQIFEYAGYLWRMTYEEVDERIRQTQNKSLAEMVKEKVNSEWNEENFRTAVGNSLANGKFSLIVAVDQINEELKHTIEYLNECGDSSYSIHAVEMQRYREGNTEVVIPRLFPQSRPKARVPVPPPTWEEYVKVLKENQPEDVVEVIEGLHHWATSDEVMKIGGRVRFGVGKEPSLLFYLQGLPTSIFSISARSGRLYLDYGGFSRRLDEEIVSEFHRMHGLNIPNDFSRYPPIKIGDAFLGQTDTIEKFKKAVIWLASKV